MKHMYLLGRWVRRLERESSFSNLSITSPTSQLILQPFFRFSYVTGSSLTSPGEPPMKHMYLLGRWVRRLEHESSFSNLSITSPTSQLILQPIRRFTYVTAHSPIFPLLQQCHSSFSNPSITLLTSQLILQSFRCFTNVKVHSPTLLLLLLRHRLFTYVTWRADHVNDYHIQEWMGPMFSRHLSYSWGKIPEKPQQGSNAGS